MVHVAKTSVKATIGLLLQVTVLDLMRELAGTSALLLTKQPIMLLGGRLLSLMLHVRVKLTLALHALAVDDAS